MPQVLLNILCFSTYLTALQLQVGKVIAIFQEKILLSM